MSKYNLRHLYFFWLVAKEGSIAKASEIADLTPQTISSQISSLEESIGGLLFKRKGRNLLITPLGKQVARYADQMFNIAEELDRFLEEKPQNRPTNLNVGISSSIHKLIAYHLIEPVFEIDQEVTLNSTTGVPSQLLTLLSQKKIDLLLTDELPEYNSDSNLFIYKLDSSTVSLFAEPKKVAKLRGNFPQSMDKETFLSNAINAPWFAQLIQWFEEHRIRPYVKAQIDDSALIKVFGSKGHGVFAAPTVIAEEVCRQYGVECIAEIKEVTDDLYGITRRSSSGNPTINAICKRDMSLQI